MKDDGENIRLFVNQMHDLTQEQVDEARLEVNKLQTQFYDRDKPFYKTFGEELITHKSNTAKLIEAMKVEWTSDIGESYRKMTDLRQHVTVLDAKLQEAEVSSRRYEGMVKQYEEKVHDISNRMKKLERARDTAKDNLREFKHYKEKEYRNLENLYHKLRFEFKEMQKVQDDFIVEIAQSNQKNIEAQQRAIQQKQQ